MTARQEVIDRVGALQRYQKKFHVQPGFIYFQLVTERDGDVNVDELLHIQQVLGYKRAWVNYKIDELRARVKTGYTFQKDLEEKKRYSRFDYEWRKRRQEVEEELEQLFGAGSKPFAEANHHAPVYLIEPLRIIGLEWPVVLDQVKTAYRKLALERHPDTGGSAQAFTALKEAYDALVDYFDDEPPF